MMTIEDRKKYEENKNNKDKEIIDFFEKLYTENLIWLVLGSLISSDSFVNIPIEQLPDVYQLHINKLKQFVQYIPLTPIPDIDKVTILNNANKGIELLTNELETIKNRIEYLKN